LTASALYHPGRAQRFSAANVSLSVSRHAGVLELPRAEAAALLSSCGAYLSLPRLESLDRDPRWTSRHVAVLRDGAIVALLPCYAPSKGAWFNPAYDLRRIAADMDVGAEAEWLYVGGRADLACGLLRHPSLGPAAERAVAKAAGEAVAEDGRSLCALYANETERPLLEAALGPGCAVWQVATGSRLAVPGDGEAGYLRALKRSHRSVVARDWRRREAVGLHAEPVEWDEVLDEACELIADVSRAHGVPDEPRLVRMRLEIWRRLDGIERFAFAVRSGRSLLAVSLGWAAGDLLQVHDVGLVPRGERPEERHLAYVEAMIYAPLRLAAERGCATVTLGAAATEAKRLRGASLAPLVALARPAEREAVELRRRAARSPA
jgi:hypothetical protein